MLIIVSFINISKMVFSLTCVSFFVPLPNFVEKASSKPAMEVVDKLNEKRGDEKEVGVRGGGEGEKEVEESKVNSEGKKKQRKVGMLLLFNTWKYFEV